MNKTPRLSTKPKRDSFQTTFHRSVPDVNDIVWKEMIEYQDYDTIFFEIREEIMNRVFEECYKKYLQKETVKFITECSYSAWKDIIQLYFFIHDTRKKYFASLESSWVADTEPLICRPDSWSRGNIPFNIDNLPKDKMQQTIEAISDYQLIKCTEYPTTNVFETAKKDYVSSFEGSLASVTKPLKDIDPCQLNVQFTNVQSASKEKVSVVENEMVPRKTSENIFYKIMKMNRCSLNSLQFTSSLKNVGKKNSPNWAKLDEVTEEPRKIFPAPLRLHVSTAVKLASMIRLTQATPRSVMFTEKSTKSEITEYKD